GGTRLVCLTRGAHGLALALDAALLVAPALPITLASPIGAGDATLAGLVWAVQEGCDAAETARRALACGAAAAMQEGTGVGERAAVEQLLAQAQVIEVTR
ncbi:MAG: 6-phosphofructokinase 2, partial [Chloroflexota bacterium]|nr:6-phosphofructokinase 2 [Chloroflexota bacterium]